MRKETTISTVFDAAAIEEGVWDAARTLLAAGLIHAVYWVSRETVCNSQTNTWKARFLGIGVAALLAFGAAARLGTHTEDSDPAFGGGDVVADFEPTSAERTSHGTKVFLLVAFPAIVGINRGLATRKQARPSTP